MPDQRQSRVVVFFVVGVAGLLAAGLARPSGDRPRDAGVEVDRPALEKAVFHCWREETCAKAGRLLHQPCDMNCWRFAAEEMEVWEYSGDLSPAKLPWEVRIDATRRPMRLDIICLRGARPTVLPGIFKIEGGRLVWVTPSMDEQWPALNPSGEYVSRPTAFTSTPANGYDKRILAPCALYEQVGAR
jgi:hypothetical protein